MLRPATAASEELIAAAGAIGGTLTVVMPLPIHGYSLGMPNPGLLPTAHERAAAQQAITATVHRLGQLHSDVDGQIVVTRHTRRAIMRIARRRSATHVLIEHSTPEPVMPAAAPISAIDTAWNPRRLLEGDLHRQLSRRLEPSVTVTKT